MPLSVPDKNNVASVVVVDIYGFPKLENLKHNNL